jgi:hypothetical protein
MQRVVVGTDSPARLPLVAAIVMSTVSGCGSSGPGATASPALSAPPTSAPAMTFRSTPSAAPASSSTPSIQDVMKIGNFAPLEPGSYFIDPDGDASTPLRVVYEIPSEGWIQWIGAAKCSDAGCAGMTITTVSNLVTDGCHDHSWADPPVGPSVDDLAAALAKLAPFEVTSPPRDVTIYGYSGKHLEWTVPDLPVEATGDDLRFSGCAEGNLSSWAAFVDTEPGDAFYGYGLGDREEFWILDVEGTRLMISAGHSPDVLPADLAALQPVLDSIRIEP